MFLFFWWVLVRNGLNKFKKGTLLNGRRLRSRAIIVLAPVVQTLHSAIHRINHYLVDKYWEHQLSLSTGQRFIQWKALSTLWTVGWCRRQVLLPVEKIPAVPSVPSVPSVPAAITTVLSVPITRNLSPTITLTLITPPSSTRDWGPDSHAAELNNNNNNNFINLLNKAFQLNITMSNI